MNIEQFNNEGFTVLDNFIDATELEEFESTISQFCKHQISKLNINSKSPDPLVNLFKRDGNYRKMLYQSMHNFVIFEKLKIKLFDKLNNDGTLKSLGFKTPIIRSGLFISLPHESHFDNPAHQDIYSYLSHKYLRFWIPLTKVDSHHGSMKVYSKSHKDGFITPDDLSNSDYATFSKKKLQSFDSTIFEFNSGPCVVFNPLLIHESVENKSDKVRIILSVDIIDLSDLGDFNDESSDFYQMLNITNKRKASRSTSVLYK